MSDEDPDREPTIAEALSHSVDPVPAKKRGPVARLRNYFLTGIIVTAPVAITLWILIGVIELIDGAVVPLIPPAYNPQTFFLRYFDIEIHIPGIGLVVVLIGLTLIGFVAAGFFGRIIVRTGERIVNRMPVVRSVYGALKQIFQTVLESSSQSFREVVLIEYPRRGIWAIGFVTSTTEGEVQNTIADPVVNIFLPTTPNPTSGFLLFVPRRDLVPLDMTVEEGIKMVVSAGIVTPPDRRPEAAKALPQVSSDGAMRREADDVAQPMPRVVSPSEER
ncbi:MAG: DUF502 domain-containing protein [Alphaproteobacteria bacterium]